MSAAILNGRLIADQIQEQIKRDIDKAKTRGLRAPALAVIMVGNDPASTIYVRNKEKACIAVGITSIPIALKADCSKASLESEIKRLNQDPNIDGILLQLPLPPHLLSDDLLEQIHPSKDVDGFHPYNLGRLAQRRPVLQPCTPYGIIRLLTAYNLTLRGQDAVIIGSSNIVGRPLIFELLNAGSTVTNCHRHTQNLADKVRLADILVVAIGNPDIVQSEWIKPGAIVIDVGINRSFDGKIIGDIHFDSAAERAAWITPVPGGIGPMTIAMLLQNTLSSYKERLSLSPDGATCSIF